MASTEQVTAQGASPEQCQTNFEHGVALSLSLWPALRLAVQNNWGGPSSADKRDWFAGAIVELFSDRPDTDVEDVETVLLQVMLDEFEVNVDDESGFEIAQQVMLLRKQCFDGDFTEVEKLRQKWTSRSSKSADAAVGFHRVERGEDDDDTDWDSDEIEEEEEEDVEMGEAPALVQKEKYVPEVDEDGFTKVVGKKKR